MSDTAPTNQNDEAFEDWNGEMGDRWLAYLDKFEGMIAPAGEAVLAKAAAQPGEQVLDVGCGGGVSAISLAKSVGSAGHVTGLDISNKLITTATQRGQEAGLENLSWQVADAQTQKLPEGAYDLVFSRFGIMFFQDSEAAFANIHAANKGGRLCCTVWGPPPENPWMMEIGKVVNSIVQQPEPDPTAPGPFRFADPQVFQAILEGAGYSNVSFEPWHGPQLIGGAGSSVEQAVQFALHGLDLEEAVAAAGEEGKQELAAKLQALFSEHDTSQGVRLPAMTWLVTAQA